MSLLMTSRPIVINPDLAYSIGLNEAIALQQINYWLQETKSGMESDGVRWIYNTTEQWLEQFPFWSESTLKRTFTRLKTLGVLKIEQLNKSQRDMTNFYTINYESELLDEVKVTESKRSKCAVPSGQNDTMEEVKVTRSIRSKRIDVIRSKCTDDPTENTTESTTENKTPSCPEASQPDALVNPNDFLSRHPTAVVFSAAKRQWGTQEDLTCAEWIWGKIIRLYEQAAESDGELVRPKEPNWVSWANEVRLMCTQDNRNHRQICELYGRVNRDPFWCKNILSPSKLREKWDELSLKLSASASKHEVREDPMFKSKYECDTRIPEGFRG
ncbi:hypothetical protein AH633_002572 [Salmonella enterica subsp. enterica]|uniref:hypothetical protein n=1 Tax=Citrobacter sp. wls615 TaxID=2576435 RepID=UPI00107AAA13|nr:hypothetical protein [Citrobacter sp. wls615]EAA0956809.1 hypothetical protein [Salmonella enterica subsp. enterica serovar Typhimurium]EAA8256795.1 hypothetical protein [Salmonella enterica subsp. enterica]EAB4465324.1 hypothetical protein [Salmonella enterica]ECD7338659.1 hypothetical protein [Salmonella enterica subsp. enterica serovar Newport]ECU7639015.1 hypothetical protein [Salmonella enterica subsp. enterica serovar 4,[5],12:i:-]NTZ33099.1 hypothetical protein [Citrobacter freundii